MDIGLISDTHGLLRPEALAALQGCAAIVHAGDIGAAEVLTALAGLAPLYAVRGNNDTSAWARDIPETRTFELDGQRLHLLHDLKTLALDPRRERIAAIVSGHSHRPLIESRDGVLYVNPGSAGPRRFSLPVTVARLSLADGRAEARLIPLF
ncbi:MAG: metallophosphoesterase family protein [Solimonas sp.]